MDKILKDALNLVISEYGLCVYTAVDTIKNSSTLKEVYKRRVRILLEEAQQ